LLGDSVHAIVAVVAVVDRAFFVEMIGIADVGDAAVLVRNVVPTAPESSSQKKKKTPPEDRSCVLRGL
jgi:hypothetical protein